MPRLPGVIRRNPIHSVFASIALLLVIAAIWHTQLEIEAGRQRRAERAAPVLVPQPKTAAIEAVGNELPATIASPPTPRLVSSATWPASLRDSEPDGAVTLDAAGRVRASLELRRLFDYFLSAIGEIDLASIRALLLEHVRGLHGEGIAADVAALFDRYIAYQQSLAAMPAPAAESLRERLQRVHDLRRQLLDDATAEAFFGDEERYTAYTLERRDVLGDHALDEAARAQRLAELDAQLSPGQRAQMQEANTAVLVDEQNRQFDALRLDPAQRQAERAALFGTEAAQRLAAADAEQAAWDARVASYRQARDAIRADARFDGAQRERALANLRARSFDAAERRRIESLEAVRAL